MAIPVIQDGQTLLEVRVNSLNPAISSINSVKGVVDEVRSKTEAVEAYVKNLHEDVATVGIKYKVDYRVFDYTTSSANYSVVVPLEAEEFPVRAVVRTFSNNTGTFSPVSTLFFNRSTNTLTFNVGNARNGKIYCEFWGPV